MSVGPPGGNGRMRRIGLLGYVAAASGPIAANARRTTAVHAKIRRREICIELGFARNTMKMFYSVVDRNESQRVAFGRPSPSCYAAKLTSRTIKDLDRLATSSSLDIVGRYACRG